MSDMKSRMPLDRTVGAAETLERIIPEELEGDGVTGKATLSLHLERYQFAAAMVGGGTLLDLACGVGYGTRLLADSRAELTHLTGVDLDGGAVGYAKRRYADPRITFVQANAIEFLARSSPFDNIVSLETVEHMEDPVGFFAALVGVLKPGGVLVSSVPTTPSMDRNPHPRSDFTERSFREFGNRHGLREVDSFCQRQPFSPWAILSGQEKRVQTSRHSLLGFYAAHPGKLLDRCWSTLRYGFENRYLTVAWKRNAVRAG